ncbi:MAG: SDR family NAD(P)-dependent oxidoreductase [Cyclobacteriaceae bacterium]|nr:SDR family NAD(P)-dependent oxidoreductase [Cyclobacteriaceae bacterium]
MENTFKNSYGEWALVTGANSGIGKALAFEITKKGLNIVLVARRKPELEEVSNKIKKKYKVSTLVTSADLTEQNGINDVLP